MTFIERCNKNPGIIGLILICLVLATPLGILIGIMFCLDLFGETDSDTNSDIEPSKENKMKWMTWYRSQTNASLSDAKAAYENK